MESRERLTALREGENGPGFVCPVCKHRFRLEYGVFARENRPFSTWQFYCRDCAKANANNLIKE